MRADGCIDEVYGRKFSFSNGPYVSKADAKNCLKDLDLMRTLDSDKPATAVMDCYGKAGVTGTDFFRTGDPCGFAKCFGGKLQSQ